MREAAAGLCQRVAHVLVLVRRRGRATGRRSRRCGSARHRRLGLYRQRAAVTGWTGKRPSRVKASARRPPGLLNRAGRKGRAPSQASSPGMGRAVRHLRHVELCDRIGDAVQPRRRLVSAAAPSDRGSVERSRSPMKPGSVAQPMPRIQATSTMPHLRLAMVLAVGPAPFQQPNATAARPSCR